MARRDCRHSAPVVAVLAAVVATVALGCVRVQPAAVGDPGESAAAPGAGVHPGFDASAPGAGDAPADQESRPAQTGARYRAAPQAKDQATGPNNTGLVVEATSSQQLEPAPSGSLPTGADSGVPAGQKDAAPGLLDSGAGGNPVVSGAGPGAGVQGAPGLARGFQGDGGDSKQPAGSTGGTPPAGPVQGTEYEWSDGDRTLRVYLQPDLTALPDGAIGSAGDSTPGRSAGGSLPGSDGPPVFRTESGSLMTLPGGALLLLDPQWDRTRVDAFFKRNNIGGSRVSDLDYATNGFFVETDPGFASLTLANLLASQDGVVVSSPNWWVEAVVK